MIIDMRTQPPPAAPETGESSEASFDESMGCVDIAAVIAQGCARLGVASTNDRVAEFVSASPEKRIGFAAIDPLSPSAEADLESAIERGFSGICVCPADQGYRPTHEHAFHIFRHCASASLPVLVANPLLRHPGSRLEFSSPALLDEIVRELPELTVILGDFGKIYLEETLLMIAKHPRVYAEISGAVARPWTLYTAMIAAHERSVLPKLLFGSGYPAETPEAVIERVYTINSVRGGTELPSVPREALRSIVERNALACVGIDPPAEPAEPRLTAGAEST